MKFKKDDLIALLWDDGAPDGYAIVEDEILDTTRWSIVHVLVFSVGEQLFQIDYSVGATESQDESPFEYAPDEIECQEVFPHEVTTIVYRSTPQEQVND